MSAAATNPTGTLTVTIVKGVDLNDIQTLGKMSPFAKLRVGNEEFTTKTHASGARNPLWNQAFIFNLDGKEAALHVTILNKGTLSDGIIGRVDIPITGLLKASAETAFTLVNPSDFKKGAGNIMIKTEYKNPNAPAPAAAMAAAAPQQKVVVVQQPAAAAPQIMYQQPTMVYAQPGYGGAPQIVYQQPMYAAQPGQQVVYMAQPGQQVVYMQPRPQ
jgi:hypothetical protein